MISLLLCLATMLLVPLLLKRGMDRVAAFLLMGQGIWMFLQSLLLAQESDLFRAAFVFLVGMAASFLGSFLWITAWDRALSSAKPQPPRRPPATAKIPPRFEKTRT